MERFLRKYDKECMKMMLLKHEETFRQQVQELHRLYRVQKLLMRDTKIKQSFADCTQYHVGGGKDAADSCVPSSSHRERRRRRRRVLNLELPADEYIERAEEDAMLEGEQEGDIELTLATGSSSWRKREETSLTSDSVASVSSSSTESGGLKLSGHGWELQQQVGDVNISYELGGGLREDRLQHPSWHLQCLSLRMT
ncbi:hypothetical protein OPV22_011732 [Ensete ventricosum]|uniref:SPX domain-containing protein n=1 Tax=Ensete ventricosum TaxID=4639 RepID=A0AAV8RGF4_ENSVE|nr:hypothetical protein OPV22_011732 [Ensete ventricosum]